MNDVFIIIHCVKCVVIIIYSSVQILVKITLISY